MNCYISRDTKFEDLTQSELLHSLVFKNSSWEDKTIVFDNAHNQGSLRDKYLTDDSKFIKIPSCDTLLWWLAMTLKHDPEVVECIYRNILSSRYPDLETIQDKSLYQKIDKSLNQYRASIVSPVIFLTNLAVAVVKYTDSPVTFREEDGVFVEIKCFETYSLIVRIIEKPKEVCQTELSTLIGIYDRFYNISSEVPKITIGEIDDLKVFGFDLSDTKNQYEKTSVFRLLSGGYLLRDEEYSLLLKCEETFGLDEISKTLKISLMDDWFVDLLEDQLTPVDKIDEEILSFRFRFECLSIRTINRLSSFYSFIYNSH